MLIILASACSLQYFSGNRSRSAILQNFTEATQTSFPTLPALNEVSSLFEEGQYNRNEYCDSSFKYQQVQYGSMTINIANYLGKSDKIQEIAKEVIIQYINLYYKSPAPMSHTFTVYVISDPQAANCYSKEDFIFVDPKQLTSTEFLQNLLGKGTGNEAYWVKSGLLSLTNSQFPDNEALHNWYQETDDLDIAGLFIARFLDEWTSEEEQSIAKMSAASLVEYALKIENIAGNKLSEQVDNDVRTRWLATLDIDRTVSYPYDGSYTDFVYSKNSNCSLIILTDTINYCLNNLPEQEILNEVSELEQIINLTYDGYLDLISYLNANAPSVKSLLSFESITYNLLEQDMLGYARGNRVYLNSRGAYYSSLHELVHTFDWNDSLEDAWLSEGFAEYLGKYLTIYPQLEKDCIYNEFNGEKIVYEGQILSSCHLLDEDQFTSAISWYLLNGGEMTPESAIDPLLYANAVSYATMYRDAKGSRGTPIAVKYEVFGFEPQENSELSYTQAASFVSYLCDTYTIDRVLDVFVNGAENGVLDGKTYDQLKAEWQFYLTMQGAEINIPGAP